MVTKEEKQEIIQGILHGNLWPSDCERPQNEDGSVACVENYRVLNEEFDARKDWNNYDYNGFFAAFYKLIIDLRSSGKLIRKTSSAPASVDPRTQIPHRDLFPKITSIEACIRHIKTAKIPYDQLDKINQLLAYLKQHNIHEEDEPETTKPGAQPQESGEVAQARALVNGLKISDIGSSTSAAGGGKWSQLIKKQEALNKYIDSAKSRNVTPALILQTVREEIDKLGNRSVG